MLGKIFVSGKYEWMEIKFNYCKPSLLLGYYAEENSILFHSILKNE